MKIIVCGPPHSGKSVFISILENLLPSDGYETVRVHKDGEGDWSNNPNQEQVKKVRQKSSEYDSKFIRHKCSVIKKSKKSVVLVDIGGMLYDDKVPVFKSCDSFIVLSSDKIHKKEWRRFGEYCGAKCIAEIDSKIDAENDSFAYDKDGVFTGVAGKLERGTSYKDSPAMVELADLIIEKSGYLEKKKSSFGAWDFSEFSVENGLCKNREVKGKKIGYFARIPIEKALFVKEQVKKISFPAKVRIDGIRGNWVSAVVADTVYENSNKTIGIYDIETHKFLFSKKLKKMDLGSPNPFYRVSVINSEKAVFVDFDLQNSILKYSSLGKMKIPAIDESKDLFISGRLPIWLLNSIIISYKNAEKYLFQPGSGFVCVKSKLNENLGKLKQNPDGINIDDFFEKKNKIVYFDMDRVLVNFAEQAEKFKILKKNQKVNWLKASIFGEKFWSSMEWFNGAENAFREISEYCRLKGIETGILSSVRIKSGRIGKMKWLKAKTGIEEKNIYLVKKSSEKSNYAGKNSLLIDDSVKNIDLFMKKGGVGFLFKEWNPQVIENIKAQIDDLVCPPKENKV